MGQVHTGANVITADAIHASTRKYGCEIGSQPTMCQVNTGANVSLLTTRAWKNRLYRLPPKTTTYILHVARITAHTHDRRKSIGKKETKERKQEKQDKKRKRKGKREKSRKARRD